MGGINGLIFCAISMIAFGIYYIYMYFRDQKHVFDIVKGKVIDVVRTNNHQGGMDYTPIFEYEYNGNTYTTKHRVTSAKYGKRAKFVSNAEYSVGDEVELRVYREYPEYAIASNKRNIRRPLYLGIILIFIGVTVLIRHL